MFSEKNLRYRLTIIVPFHRIEGTEFFFLWISTIINFPSIKVVLVVDSLDSELLESLKILEQSNVSVLCKKVNSPGLARNFAFTQINSDYVMFVDSDDYIYLQAIETLIHNTSHTSTIIASYEKYDVKTGNILKFNCPMNTLELAVEPAFWRILFKAEEIADLKFTRFRMAEDQIFLASYFKKEREVHSTGAIIYRYTVNQDGQISTSSTAREELSEAIQYFQKTNLVSSSEFARYVFAKLNISAGASGFRRLLLSCYPIRDLFRLLKNLFQRKIQRRFDPGIELDWIVNG